MRSRDFELVIAGGATNKGYLLELLESDDIRAGAGRHHLARSLRQPARRAHRTLRADDRIRRRPGRGRDPLLPARPRCRARQLLRGHDAHLVRADSARPTASRSTCPTAERATGSRSTPWAVVALPRPPRRSRGGRRRCAKRASTRRVSTSAAARCGVLYDASETRPPGRGRGPSVSLRLAERGPGVRRHAGRWWSRSTSKPGDRVEAGPGARPARSDEDGDRLPGARSRAW